MRIGTAWMGIAALLPGAAMAGELGIRVSEIYLAHPVQGTSVQYVELRDPEADASYPSPLIKVAVYDEGGVLVGSVPLDTALVVAHRSNLLIASAGFASAFPSITPQATLGFVLPSSGQACFENANGVICCLAWGNAIADDGAFSNASGPAPPPGQALTLDPTTGMTALVGPTPGAPNPNPATTPDAGPMGTVDDPPGTIDAGPQPPGEVDNGGGCDCRAAASRAPSPLAAALLGLVLLFAARARRRSR